MYKVGMFGHKTGSLHVQEELIKNKVNDTLDVLKFQYGKDFIINTDGEIGVGQTIIDHAINININYHLFLTCPIDNFNQPLYNEWTDKQKNKLLEHYSKSYSTTIRSNIYKKEFENERDKSLIDDSCFIVCFWEGKKQGRTFDLIKYALFQNRIVINGFNELKLITNMDLKKRKI